MTDAIVTVAGTKETVWAKNALYNFRKINMGQGFQKGTDT